MKILIVGSGGREHVLAWKIKQSPKVEKIYCAPGNGGIAQIAECVDIEATDIKMLASFAKKKKIDLTIVGPEAPLVAGIVDTFEKKGLKVFGPNSQAAQLEGSKIFAKEFMHRRSIPTASFKAFDTAAAAREFLKQTQFPVVVKADGLAAGKGVMLCANLKEGEEAIEQMMVQKVFKAAGERIIIEECLEGEEVSVLAISDGEDYVILESAQDHKRIFDEDLGPNTGGMGAYSPAPILNEDLHKKIDARVIEPTIRGMHRNGHPFKGVLYAGLMMTLDGPKVLEFNVRFGDPEAQAVLPRLETDLVDILLASVKGGLKDMTCTWNPRSCVCVVMTSGGYPGEYEKGKVITGLEEAAKQKDAMIFHAGTKREDDKIVTSGGRVLGVTSLGDNIGKAIQKTYEAVEKINFDRSFFRRDIGAKAVDKKGRSRISSHLTHDK